MNDPFRTFLGVSATADAYRLLALSPGQRHPGAVLQALQSQLQRVENHSDHASSDAEAVRARLYEAARTLLEAGDGAEVAPVVATGAAASMESSASARQQDSAARPAPQRPSLGAAPPPAPVKRPVFATPPHGLDLTSFDRHILAILVACGGWNADSRAKLVALAAEHNVAPQGLLKVVTGLCGHARMGAARFDVAQITQGARRFEQVPAAPLPAPAPITSDDIAESLLPELREGGVWATIKLSLFFGAVTVLAGLLLLRVLIGSDTASDTTRVVEQPRNEGPIDLGSTPDDPPLVPSPRQPTLPTWPEAPTFRGERSFAAASDAIDQSPRLPELLDELSRKLSVAESPSATSRQDWLVFNEQAALIWVQGDRAIVRAVRANVFDVLFAIADRSAIAEEFISSLAAPASAPLDDPLDLWRGAWAAGILAETANRADLPAFLQQVAATHVQTILAVDQSPSARTFGAAARAWLIQRVPRLIELAQAAPGANDFWEAWLVAQESLGRDDAYDTALFSAIAEILRSSVDLAQPGPLVNVLGRLVEEANFNESAVVRELALSLYGESAIDTRDLWVFTSLLLHHRVAPWMNESLLVTADASAESRRNAMIELERSWPRPSPPVESAGAGRGITVDPAMGARWIALARQQVAGLSRLSQPIERQPSALMRRIVLAAWVNEAALALATGHAAEAEQAMRLVESGWNSTTNAQQPTLPPFQTPRPGGGNRPTLPNLPNTPTPGGPVPSNPGMPVAPGGVPVNPGGNAPGGTSQSGHAVGPDGTWAAAYNAAERNVDERMELLRSLRSTAGSDLGPIDARRLIEEAYRGPIPELRLFAQTITVELFTRGPNIARELVDQFVDAPAREITATFLGSYLSRSIPGPQSSAWQRGARLALLEHALRLMPFAELEIDLLAEALAESYADGARMLQPNAAGSVMWSHADAAIEAQVTEWRQIAARSMVSDPVPDAFPKIEQRHATRRALAQGPIERALASQITVLELLTYIATGEQPVLSGEARSLLERAALERMESDHVLEQSLRTELAITQVWMLRLEVAEGEGAISDE